MAKRRKGKRKGSRRKGTKRSVRSRFGKAHKPGVAETLGVLKAVYDVETTGVLFQVQKDLLLHPSKAQLQMAVDQTLVAVKGKGGPAIAGVLISNIDKLPLIGKPLRPLKRKADRILMSWIGMRV